MRPTHFLRLAALSAAATPLMSFAAEHAVSAGDLTFTLEDSTGEYAMTDGAHRFAGRLPGGATTVKASAGAIRFTLASGAEGEVRPTPGATASLLFSRTSVAGGKAASLPPFPDFTTVPSGLNVMSHQKVFAEPTFEACTVCTPWVLFDETGKTLIVSPASQFFTASMLGDAKTRVASGGNKDLKTLPAGFTGTTLVSTGANISGAYEKWGAALRELHGKKQSVSNVADTTLAKFGILTDNSGGYYYYNYDYKEGLNYEESLVRFISRCRESGIPVGYLQLDSWWYSKHTPAPGDGTDPIKNKNLPAGEWNSYGGVSSWTAHPGVFPKGLAAFHDRVKVPFFAHNRYLDKNGPYAKRFEISGITAIDIGYWNEIAEYAQKNGIETYIQDWIDTMYDNSPETRSVPGKGEKFLDNMASAMASHGRTMQYCMAYPLTMMQGVKYANLTTIRAAGDGMHRRYWTDLLFNAPFIRSVGAWPACDVVASRDKPAMTYASLTGGPVGIGDAFDKIDRANVFMATRTDGVLVKPDTALVPLARSYFTMAHRKAEPLIGVATTTHDARRTAYLFAFANTPRRSNTPIPGVNDFAVTPAELGFAGEVIAWDPASGAMSRAKPGETVKGALSGKQACAHLIVIPVSPSGVNVIGDIGKTVTMGRARVAAYAETATGVTLKLSFAPTEDAVVIAGECSGELVATATGGTAEVLPREAGSGLFKVRVARTAGQAGEVTLALSRR